MTQGSRPEHPGWNPRRLREHRERAGLSLEKACRQVQKAAKQLGVPVPGITPSMLWKHETGKVYPGQAYQELYCAAYGASEAGLGFRPPLPGDEEYLVQVAVRKRGSIDDQEPPLLISSVVDLREKATMALQRAIRFSAYAGTGTFSSELVEQVGDEVRLVAKRCADESAISVLADLVEIQGVTFDLTERSANPKNTRDLYFLAGIVSGLLAEMNEDLANFHASRVHARTAYICAENAGSDALRAWARFQQMNTAYWSGAPNEVIRYAQMSSGLVDTVTGSGAVRLHSMEARAWAALGNAEAAETALAKAADVRERVGSDEVDEIGGHLLYPRSRQLYHEVDALLWLPETPQRVETAALEAVRGYETAPINEKSYVNETLSRIGLARARVIQGDVDGAEEALTRVFDLAPAGRAASIRTSVQRLHGLLSKPRFADAVSARRLQLGIEEFCQVSSGAATPLT